MHDLILRLLSRGATLVLFLPRPYKRVVALAVDTALCVLAVWLALYLITGEFVSLSGTAIFAVVFSVMLAPPIFIIFGLYRAIFRYSGLPAMLAMVKAMILYGAAFLIIFTFWGVEGISKKMGFIQPVLLFLLVGASRVLARVWLGELYHHRLIENRLPGTLIYGAGSAGRQLASAIANSSKIRVVGFLDDDSNLHGHLLNGLPIYSPVNLIEILRISPINDVILALPSVSRQRRNEILNNLRSYKLALRTLPSLGDIVTGKVTLSDLRDLDVDDLLGREPVKPDPLLLMLNVRDKTLLVTGAGGSIGGELCRQIIKYNPRQLLLVEMSEYALYQIHQELQALIKSMPKSPSVGKSTEEGGSEIDPPYQSNIKIVPLLASVCDNARMEDIIGTWKPHTIYHAAAFKHVPLVEQNPAEGVRNNVWGTLVCAQVAARNCVSNFVLISTDKAVRPTNIMGATKRLSEMVLQALAESNALLTTEDSRMPPGVKTIFSIVRFGNVLGSSGSVVPLFREQIKNGGPITLTHVDITRYFMTIPEAAQLVIQAGAMGRGGDVFVLDMGEPIKIIDLAYKMIELSGLEVRNALHPDGDIEINFTGLRSGEKLHEELLIGDDLEPTQHPGILRAYEQYLGWPQLEEKLNALKTALSVNDVPIIRTLLQQIVIEYQPSDKVVDWVYRATKEREALIGESTCPNRIL
jgi:FlaA1/EpsC-like NDP-sugar epimerase